MQVMELFFQGARKAGPRDTMLRLDTTAVGTLNAVVFWFDLHLDDACTITSGASPCLCAAKAWMHACMDREWHAGDRPALSTRT